MNWRRYRINETAIDNWNKANIIRDYGTKRDFP
jgi:hypothetical protein